MNETLAALARVEGGLAPATGEAVVPVPPVQSHISDGHRLLKTVSRLQHSLYTSAEFNKAAVHLPASYFLNSLIPGIRALMNRKVAMRVTAAISRARKQSAAYGVKHAGEAEYIAEALFDSAYFKAHKEHLSRVQLRDQIASLLREDATIELILPVFSRKPASPMKNRGMLPDLAEVASLAQLAGAAQVANALSPTGCRITILADGHKYRRACLTSAADVDAYQKALRFWIEALGVKGQINLLDYESSISPASCGIDRTMREHMYTARVTQLITTYRHCFDADDVPQTLERLEAAGSVGVQIAYTMRSMLTSVNYHAGSELGGAFANFHDDASQALYAQHIGALHSPLSVAAGPWECGKTARYLSRSEQLSLLESMRRSAWEAAVRYVAISLVDRELQIVRKRWPRAIKLTIHAKPGELHCITTSRRDVSMTAQHCTGGIHFTPDGAEFDFRYRVEREAESQVPVLVERDSLMGLAPELFGPLVGMQQTMQPFMYTNNEGAVQEEGVAERLIAGDAS